MITEPAPSAYRPPSPLLDTLPLLRAGEAGEVVARILALQGDPAERATSGSRTTISGM